VNNNNSNNTVLEPKNQEIKFTPDYESGKSIFSRVFKELENDNNGLVHYDKLPEGLISTGKSMLEKLF